MNNLNVIKKKEFLEIKNCSICKKSLSLDNFYLSRNGSYNFCCKPCDRKRKAVYRVENKEKIAIAEHKYITSERGYMLEVVNGIFSRHKKKNARLKWIPNCTKEQVYEELMLYIQDNGRVCEYCKEPWTYKRVLVEKNRKHNERGPKIMTNFSIDRLDATKSYVLDNIVFCCVGCNLRKNQVRLSDIFNIIRVYVKRKISNERK
jgi:hypothetical protein